MEIPEKILVEPANVFFEPGWGEGGGLPSRWESAYCTVTGLLAACYAFGVAWLNSRGGGCSKEPGLCWTVDLLNFPPGLIPVFQSSVSHSN